MILLISTAIATSCIPRTPRHVWLAGPPLVERTGPLLLIGNGADVRVLDPSGESIPFRAEGEARYMRLRPTFGTWPDGPLQLVHDTWDGGRTVGEIVVTDQPSASTPPLDDGWIRERDSLRTTVRLAPATSYLELEIQGHGIAALEEVGYAGQHVDFEFFKRREHSCRDSSRWAPYAGDLTLRLVGVGFDGRRAFGPWQTVPSLAVSNNRSSSERPATTWNGRRMSRFPHNPVQHPTAKRCERLVPKHAPQREGPAAPDVAALFFTSDQTLEAVHHSDNTVRLRDKTWTSEQFNWPLYATERDGVLYLAGGSGASVELGAFGQDVTRRRWTRHRPGRLTFAGDTLQLAMDTTNHGELVLLDPDTLEEVEILPRSTALGSIFLKDLDLRLQPLVSGHVAVVGSRQPHLLGFTPAIEHKPVLAAQETSDGVALGWVAEGYLWSQHFSCDTQ